MLIFGLYEGQRLTLDIPTGMTVLEMKVMIKEKLGISADLYRREKKVLVLSYAGAQLADNWVFSDLGILPATTIRLQLKEEVKPVLYIKCSHSQETISLYEEITIPHMKLKQVRSLASMKSGLPVGIFRLTTTDGREMFDTHRLEDYGVDVGHTILLENWDGWNEFLNLAIMGYTPQVVSQIGGDEIVARYQMKVALFIAAHFGHVDLARSMLRQGVRSDDPTGYHPARMWCMDVGHIDSLKCPVHEATLCGQLGVLRLFVNHDISCVKCKDGHGLEPLNLALRNKIKNCASFLLSKQWIKVNITKTFAVHITTYTKLKKWCERAKERALLKYGQSKSSLKRRSFNHGPLVTNGVLVDGFSKSPMTGKPKSVLQKEDRDAKMKERRRPSFAISVGELLGSTEEPEAYFKTVVANQRVKALHGPGKFSLRWGKIPKEVKKVPDASDAKKGLAKRSHSGNISETFKVSAPSTISDEVETFDGNVNKLPPIMQTDASKVGMPHQFKTTRSVVKYSSLTKLTPRSRGGLRMMTLGNTMSNTNPPQFSDRYDRSKLEQSVSGISEKSGDNMQIKNSPTSVSSIIDDVNFEEDKKPRKSRRYHREISSALLLEKAKFSALCSLPLPLISYEQDRRPFFYHQGLRQGALVDSALELVAKYKGDSSRERAIKSLTLATAFSEKPWLEQVRVALNLSSNSLKRKVRRLDRERKRSLATSTTF